MERHIGQMCRRIWVAVCRSSAFFQMFSPFVEFGRLRVVSLADQAASVEWGFQESLAG
jgi:hypothetical protein